ncbi:unnamed protein product [Protopolystoma xenopodis]|uniref:DNA-directed DNA polymerase family B exonuclease domain-containing protein n=1 Tax=Protopolystoma xenopodis TaxID=117903 RepID=A0A3S5AZK1_9PLAT|nr:unnamed protein product [Protopolystoma xenopodis]
MRQKLASWGPQYTPSMSTHSQPDQESGGVDVEPNERALLGRFLTRLHRLDPDLIVGYDLWGHQLDVILHRLLANRVAHWHRLGRLRRSQAFQINTNNKVNDIPC